MNKKLRETTEQIKIKGSSSCFVLNLRISGESCLIFNWHSYRAVSGILVFIGHLQRMANTAYTGETTLLQLLLVIRWWRQYKKTNWKPNILREIILKKKWSVISNLFLLSCIFHYISNWWKELGLFLTSFFNMKS